MIAEKIPSFDFLQDVWLSHCYDGFPRGVTVMPETKRVPCRNQENFIALIVQGFFQKDTYVDVYPESHLTETGILANKIFLDFDSPNKTETYEEVLSVCRYFLSAYDYTPRVYFSGNKGFHIFMDFESVAVDPYAIHLYVERMAETLKLKTLDWHVVGDKRRISRLPYSLNSKSGLWCVPIEPGWTLDEIVNFAAEPGLRSIAVEKCEGLDEQLADLNELVLKQKQANMAGMIPIPISSGEKRHLAYLADITELFRIADRYEGGRHRTLFSYLIPRLCYCYSHGKYQDLSPPDQEVVDAQVIAAITTWVESTPVSDPDEGFRKPMDEYTTYTKRCLRRLRTQGWNGWTKETFWLKFPDLMQYWMEPSK